MMKVSISAIEKERDEDEEGKVILMMDSEERMDSEEKQLLDKKEEQLLQETKQVSVKEERE